jgi:hypothetical protein
VYQQYQQADDFKILGAELAAGGPHSTALGMLLYPVLAAHSATVPLETHFHLLEPGVVRQLLLVLMLFLHMTMPSM